MPKYTDDQIKKALECCNNGSCIGCPFHCGSSTCLADLQRTALDLINRQEAEIERLKPEVKVLTENSISAKFPCRVLCSKGLILTKDLAQYDELIADISAEAIKEFKKKLLDGLAPNDIAAIAIKSRLEMVGEGE